MSCLLLLTESLEIIMAMTSCRISLCEIYVKDKLSIQTKSTPLKKANWKTNSLCVKTKKT